MAPEIIDIFEAKETYHKHFEVRYIRFRVDSLSILKVCSFTLEVD